MAAPSPKTRRSSPEQPLSGWRLRWYTIIFEADTRAGRLFDVVLIVVILLSIGVVMADSVQSVHLAYGGLLVALEWFFTALFTAEYIARLVCAVSYTHLRAHETDSYLVCRLLLE